MYATGDSDDAKTFNCIQRSHQQALETYPSYLAMALLSGFRFPVFTSAVGVLYVAARLQWAEHYSKLGAEQRYSSYLAKQVWTPVIMLTLSSLYYAGELLAGKSIDFQKFF